MNHRRGYSDEFRRHRVGILLGAAALAGTLFTGAAQAADKPKPTSSCVACHTDAEKLKVEAAKVPVPAGSALQAGKG